MGVTGADALLSLIKQKQDLQGYRERHWTGTLEDYMEIVMANPKVARNAYQRLYDMILSHGVTEYTRQHERYTPLPALRRPHRRRARRRLRPRRAAHAPRPQHQVRGLRLRHREAHPAPARPGGLLEVHHRPPAEEGPRALLRTRRKARSTPSAGRPTSAAAARTACSGARCTRTRCTSSRSRARTRSTPRSTGALGRATTGSSAPGNLCPFCRKTFQDLMTQYEGNWEKVIRHVVVKRLILSEKDRVGIGTFQPKDEKNQDSTELTGDLNYRKIAEYGSDSDPRAFNFDGELNIANRGHHRVHRDPEAGRGLPLRPAGRVAGAQDQAQEVPADGHRRGHRRAHQRAGVPEAPEQRADGGVPRPHGQDRHPLQHASGRTRSRSTPATSTTGRSRASTSPPTPSRWRPCGRC